MPAMAARRATTGWFDSAFWIILNVRITMMPINNTVRKTKKLRNDLLILVVLSRSYSLISL